MRLTECAVSEAVGAILMHNIADADGRRILKKGTRITTEHATRLAAAGRSTVPVAILEADDVHEDEAATQLAQALQAPGLEVSPADGGRVNLRTTMDGLLEIDAERLLELNLVPGITLATRRHHTVVGPNQETDNIATLKIIPFAVPGRDLERALELATARPGIIRLRAFPSGRRVAMLFVGEPTVHEKLHKEYLPATRTRLERMGAEVGAIEDVEDDEYAIGQATLRLAGVADLIIIAGQTSVMDEDDTTLRALRHVGAVDTLSGAPVEPGNLLALAYLPHTAVMCAPGCAKGLRRNVVDLVLPRLLLGDRLTRRDIAALGLGGFMTKEERAGDTIG